MSDEDNNALDEIIKSFLFVMIVCFFIFTGMGFLFGYLLGRG